MKIAGFQKMSVIDFPGEVACTIFLYGCNFRCGFCYNPELVVKKCSGGFNEGKILDFLERRIGKIDGVCISGGEPLMSLDFGFVNKIKALGFKVKIDTNGAFPDRLKKMIDLGLVDYIAMDIKAPRENYNKVAGVNIDISKIEESIRLIHNFGNYEFRITVVGSLHDAYSLRAIGKWLKRTCGGRPKKFFLQGFKSGNEMISSDFNKEISFPEEKLKEFKECVDEFFEDVEIRV